MKIGLDIDGVLCDFIGGIYKHFGKEYTPVLTWHDELVSNHWKDIVDDEDFWMNLEPLVNPKEIDFNVYCYVTARPIPTCISFLWLQKHGFQYAPVFSTGLYKNDACKIDSINRLNLDYFVDDNYGNFTDINLKTNTFCFLQTQSYNIDEQCSKNMRIKTVLDLPKKIKQQIQDELL